MRFLLFILATIIITSCNPSATRKSFSGTDSLVIHFKNEQEITKTMQATDPAAIRKVIGFIDASPAKESQCGYDGKMFFYEKGQQIQEVDFQMGIDSCRRFTFFLDGKLISTKMNNEAADFFGSLQRGQLWY